MVVVVVGGGGVGEADRFGRGDMLGAGGGRTGAGVIKGRGERGIVWLGEVDG